MFSSQRCGLKIVRKTLQWRFLCVDFSTFLFQLNEEKVWELFLLIWLWSISYQWMTFCTTKKKKKKGSGVIGVEEEWDKKCLNFNRDKFNFNKREWTSIIYVLTHRVKEEITVMHSKLVNNNLELSEDAKLLQIYD